MRILFTCCLILLLSGCAANQKQYKSPLHQLDVLPQQKSKNDDTAAHPDERDLISYEELASLSPGHKPPLSSDEAGIWMVMDQAEAQLKSSGHLIRDPELNAYLQSIVCRLTPEYCKDIRIYLVQVPYFNATMAPNGAMQVWSGLLLRVKNEAQLAGVLGHEIGHYLRRHSLQQMRAAIDQTNSLMFVNLAGAIVGLPVGDVLRYLVVGNLQSYSRDFEREADGYGLALLARAGYDPREMAKVWDQLIEENKADAEHSTPSPFFASHPAAEERLEALQDLAEKIIAQGGEFHTNEDCFLRHIQPHRAQYLRDELHLRNFDKTEKFFDMLLARGHNPAELHYFKGELYRLRDLEGDDALALAAYEQALAFPDKLPMEIYRAMALLYRKQGKNTAAADAFSQYLAVNPSCPEREMIEHMIKRLRQ